MIMADNYHHKRKSVRSFYDSPVENFRCLGPSSEHTVDNKRTHGMYVCRPVVFMNIFINFLCEMIFRVGGQLSLSSVVPGGILWMQAVSAGANVKDVARSWVYHTDCHKLITFFVFL